MTLRHALLASLSLTFLASAAAASTLVIRDSIGADSSLTDGMGGGLTHHDGADWNTPGLVVNAPVDGELTQARFVIFGRDVNLNPENDLADMYGFPIEFHIWRDGVEVGTDSFDLNPRGTHVTGHTDIDVNSQFNNGFITIVPFGQTGPSNEFTTFLLTVDLSSFNIAVQSGNEYVMGLIQDNADPFIGNGGFYRISASRAAGFEDVFRAFNTNATLSPWYLKSKLGNSFEQYAGAFTLAPFIEGDFDFDNDVDGADFLQWQAAFGSADSMADGNDDGIVDGDDLAIWATHFGEVAASSASSEAVPEPSGLCLTALAALLMASAHRTLARLGY